MVPLLYSLADAHYRVRNYITTCLENRLEQKIHRPSNDQISAIRRITLNLALCYQLGFGIQRNIDKYQSLLQEQGISESDLENDITLVKASIRQPGHKESNFEILNDQGHFMEFNLSQQYREHQDSREAELQYQREIGSIESVLGVGHRLVIILKRKLSSLLGSEGRWREAEKLQLQVMEASEKIWGEDHLSLQVFRLDLASTYREQGRWKEAEGLFVQVGEIYSRVLGPEHQGTLTCMAHLASAYRYQGQ